MHRISYGVLREKQIFRRTLMMDLTAKIAPCNFISPSLLCLTSLPLFKDCVQLNQYKLKDEIGKVPSLIAPFHRLSHFPSPFRLLHVCQVARTSSRTRSNSLSAILSPRLSSFPKLCVNYQAMGELEDG